MLTLWWAAYSLFYTEHLLEWRAQAGKPIAFSAALRESLGTWLAWLPISLFLIWLVERYPLERDRLWRSVWMVNLGVATVILARALYVWVANPVFGWYEALPSFSDILLTSLRNNLLTCWFIVGLAHAILFSRRSRQRELEISELKLDLANARLQALTAQLNPHFLFNTLNSVAELVHHAPQSADRMLVGLSALLRKSLETPDGARYSLREEMDMIAHYLDIQSVRLGPRLVTRIDIDPECGSAIVPCLLLQPIVENAIVHSIARHVPGGVLSIEAKRNGRRLRIVVSNEGAPHSSSAGGSGIGLKNTRGRLQCAYGDDFDFQILKTSDHSACVIIDIPCETDETSPAAMPGPTHLTALS
jgi:hypothetical protein